MFASPHPTELMKLLDADRMVERDRNLFCPHYLSCLDEAITKNWVSWSCSGCLLLGTGAGSRAAEFGEVPS